MVPENRKPHLPPVPGTEPEPKPDPEPVPGSEPDVASTGFRVETASSWSEQQKPDWHGDKPENDDAHSKRQMALLRTSS
jgi:hypothetical protein